MTKKRSNNFKKKNKTINQNPKTINKKEKMTSNFQQQQLQGGAVVAPANLRKFFLLITFEF